MKDHRRRGGDDISSGGSTRTASVVPGKATLTAALPVQRMTPKTTQEAVGQPGREDAPPVRRESSGDEANASPPITSPIAASDTSERKLPRLQLKSIISMVPSGTIDAGRVQPVQRKANGGAPSAGAPTQTASDGVAGTGGPLPHLAQIQAAFGHHDVSAVQAHQGPAARDATRTLGAEAYAFGNSVAFGSSPDLHTAAHEAAHVVQQRGGVQLKGGIDQPGDTYERHADTVADAVVAGKSAEPLLDRLPGTGSIGGPTNIQRMPAPSAGSGPAADTRNPELSAASSGASAATAVATNAADARSTATAAGPTGDPLALPAHTHADDVARAESIYETAQSTGNGILSSLVPGYLAARDQLDATAVAELGGRMIGAFTVVHGAKPALDQMLKTLPHRSVQGGGGDELALARRQQTVEAKAPLLVPLIQSVDALVASAITPHVFQGREVAGQVVVVSLDGPASQRTAKLTGELERTVGMLLLVSELKAQLLDTKKGLDRTALGVARGKLRRWASRPLDLAFLRAALGGFWDVLDATASGPNETKPSDVLGDATKQAKHTGWLGDVGQVDVTTVCNELRSRSRDGAEFAIRQLYTADPDARAKLLIQIKERGMLDALCSSVGWADVKELHDSLGFGFAEIKTDLQHYFLGERKYGPDLGHEWENHDSSLHALVARLGGAGSVLNFALDVGTFGFNSSYGKALDDNSQGLTSDAEASRDKMHAAGKTAAIAAVSMLTGGLADKFVRGGAAAVSTARAIGAGAAGGSAGAVGAVAASDAYGNVSGDQRGFSSAEDYVKAALLGGAIGGAVGGVTQGISNRVAKQYLPRASGLAEGAPAPMPTVEDHAAALPSNSPSMAPSVQQPDWITEQARSVQRLLDRPIAPAARAELEGRWTRIHELVARLRTVQPDADPASMERAHVEIDRVRQAASTTIEGVDGANEAKTASKNWKRADQMVRDWAQTKEPLTLSRILEINETLDEGLPHHGGVPGQLRAYDVAAGGRLDKTYVPKGQVPAGMNSFLDWYHANEPTMPPIELAAGAYQRLVSIHPFMDANGRTCRLVMDWILERHGLPPGTFSDGEHNVAVFWSDESSTSGGVTPEQAVRATTTAVERTLDRLLQASSRGVISP